MYRITTKATIAMLVMLSIQSVCYAQQGRKLIVTGGGPFANGNLVDLAGWTTFTYEAQESTIFNSGLATSLDALETIYGNHLSDPSISNALVIAYDLGGLSMRGALQRNSAASSSVGGLMLVGVPNNGSVLTQRFFSSVAQTPTQVQSTIDILEGFASTANNCRTCDQLSLLQDLNDLVTDPQYLGLQGQARDGSPYLNGLNATSPVPTVVLYGDIGDEPYPLSRILGSTSLQSSAGNNYVSCMEDEIEDRRSEINDLYADATVNQIATFSFLALKFLKGVLTPSDEGLGTFIDGIEESAQQIRNQITALKRRNRDLGEVLECEFVFQSMNAEWNLWTSRGYEETTYEIVIADCCSDNCYEYFGDDDEYILDACLLSCYDNDWNNANIEYYDCTVTTQEVTVYIDRLPTDGIYTHQEMDLNETTPVYVMENTDHKQEVAAPDYQNATAVYQDIFAGGAGSAFSLQPR